MADQMLIWGGFFLAVALLMLISRKNIWMGLVYGALVLGFLTVSSISDFRVATVETLVDPSVLFLALAVGMIPILGGFMERSGLIDDLVENMRMPRRAFLPLSAGMIGMLPMPGGALLSAPVLEKGGSDLSGDHKTAINVWFRHLLFLAYPLGPALIVSAKVASLDIYVAIAHLSPFLVISIATGYIFLLRQVRGERRYEGKFDRRGLLVPVGVLAVAPILDFSMGQLLETDVPEAHLTLAVFIGVVLAYYMGDMDRKDIIPVMKRMRPWNFGMIIIGVFLFLNIFRVSEVPALIKDLEPSRVLLLVVFGAILGFVTGRVNLPASIIIPIYLAVYSTPSMDPVTFSVTFYSIFLGYILSPVHPCLSVSLEYFDAGFLQYLRLMALPAGIGLAICLVAGLLLF